MEKEFDVYFFYVIINVEKDDHSWKWIYYLPNRTFSHFPGTFEDIEDETYVQVVEEDKAEEKCESQEKCVAVIKTRGNFKATLLDFVDIDVLNKSDDKVTLLKIKDISKDTNVHATNQWEDIDKCCPSHGLVNTEEILRKVNDTMQRISCDISTDEFLKKYVSKRKSVMLVNCTKNWLAQSKWSMKYLLKEGAGQLVWKTDFEFKDGPRESEFFTGIDIEHIMKDNGTIRIFDRLGRRYHNFWNKQGSKRDTDKMYLFDHYEKPSPVPRDYFEMAGILTNYQWIIISQKDTGRCIIIKVISSSNISFL